MAEEVFRVNDAGGIMHLKHFLKQVRCQSYKAIGDDRFILSPPAKVIVDNGAMYDRAEKAIRKFLGWELPPSIEESTPIPDAPHATFKLADVMPNMGEKEMQAVEHKSETFIAALSCYEGSIAIFMPAKFAGHKFSVIYEKGVFLISRDEKEGIAANYSTIDRCIVNFAKKKWFGDQRFPLLVQYKQEVEYSGGNFMLSLPIKTEEPEVVPTPIPVAAPANAPEKKTETKRERAGRYIAWLNDFIVQQGYSVVVEEGRLVLERQDRIG